MTIFYVDSTRADDTGAGTSWATAKKTLQAGANLLAAAGDSLWLGSNATHTTPGSLISIPAITPTAIAPLSIQGRNPADDSRALADINMNGGNHTLFDPIPDYTIFQNLEIRGNTGFSLLDLTGTSFCQVVECELHTAPAGITAGTETRVVSAIIRDCIFGIFGTLADSEVTGCLFHTMSSIIIDVGVNSVVRFNRFRNSSDKSIRVVGNNTQVSFNSIVGKDLASIPGILYLSGTGGVLVGNIIQDYAIGIDFGTTLGPTTKGHNVFHSNGANESNVPGTILQIAPDIIADPQFNDLANNDFTVNNSSLREQLFGVRLNYGADQGGSPASAVGRIQRQIFLG